jgi:uncharacterized membrane protein
MADIPSSNSGMSTPPAGGSAGSGLEPNVASALCYLCGWLTGLIFILIEKNNKTVKFHAWQALLLNIALIGYWVAMTIISVVLSQIAPVLVMIVGLINLVVWLGYFVVWIILMVKAYLGSSLELPVIAGIAHKQADK